MVTNALPPQMVTNTLFGNPCHCSINVQVYNSANFQQCPFAVTTQEYADLNDDLVVDL